MWRNFLTLIFAPYLDQLEVESDDLFVDTHDEFCKIECILSKFEVWRNTDMDSYKEAFVSLCLPKVSKLIFKEY